MNKELKLKFPKNVFCVKPEGWTDYLIIREGSCCCGESHKGLAICTSKNKEWGNGGSLKNSDVKKLIKLLQKHLDTHEGSDKDCCPFINHLKTTYKIIVNAREMEFTGEFISYKQAVELAIPSPAFNAVYTVACHDQTGMSYTLVPDESVAASEGMIINVSNTNNA